MKLCKLGLLLTIILCSCDHKTEEVATENIERKTVDTIGAITGKLTTVNEDSVVKLLQGKWRETEYPFRTAQFKNGTVKFIEEGVVEASTFKEYSISNTCPYKVENIQHAGADAMFFVMVQANTCEILRLSNDTMSLGGFSQSTNNDYQIIYKKIE